MSRVPPRARASPSSRRENFGAAVSIRIGEEVVGGTGAIDGMMLVLFPAPAGT